MKRIIALMLVAVLAISIVGCSDKEEKPNNGTDTGSSQFVNSDTNNSSDGDSSQGSSDIPHTMYDDLPNYVNVLFREIYISTPAWRNDEEIYGNKLSDSNDYVIAITYNVDDEYTGAIEDILDETYTPFTKTVGRHAVTNEFGEYKLTTKEKVTLDCGAEAIKFEGTMSANQYSSVVDYYVYGYSFVYDRATITVGASIVNPDVIDAKKDTMKDIIDRMVKTIRTQP
ncbi:MAG: hypothetical protein ACI4II_04600 [Acutalibacteraceae bacterium]